jgi:predicted Holliday junction resolvase-like endonuclease
MVIAPFICITMIVIINALVLFILMDKYVKSTALQFSKVQELSESAFKSIVCKTAEEKVYVNAKEQELQLKNNLLKDTLEAERQLIHRQLEEDPPVHQAVVVKTSDGKELDISKDWELL